MTYLREELCGGIGKNIVVPGGIHGPVRGTPSKQYAGLPPPSGATWVPGFINGPIGGTPGEIRSACDFLEEVW